jgi:predicted transcriptional regulator
LDESKDASTILLYFIRDNPGCHLRGIKRAMGISMGTVQYHLDRLEKSGKITSTRRGLYKHYFPVGVFQDNEKEVLEILTHETARKILMSIIEQKSPNQTHIVNEMNISTASVSWHLKRLINLGIIDEIKEGKYRKYQLREKDPKFIIRLIRNYYPSIWDKWSVRIVEMFLSLPSKSEIE